jgi:hypothetical protein
VPVLSCTLTSNFCCTWHFTLSLPQPQAQGKSGGGPAGPMAAAGQQEVGGCKH